MADVQRRAVVKKIVPKPETPKPETRGPEPDVLRAADAPFAKDEPTERRFEVPPEAVDIARRGVLVKISVGDRTISPVKYGSLVVPGCSMEFLVPPNVDTTEDFDREVEKRYRLLRSAQQKIFERELEDYISQVKKAHKAAVAALD